MSPPKTRDGAPTFKTPRGFGTFGRGFGFDPKAHRGCVVRVRCLQNGRARARRVEPDGDVQGRERVFRARRQKLRLWRVQRRRPRAKRRPTRRTPGRFGSHHDVRVVHLVPERLRGKRPCLEGSSEPTTATSTSAMVALSSRTPQKLAEARRRARRVPHVAGLDEQPVGLGSAQHLGHRDRERRRPRSTGTTRHLAHDHSAVLASGGGGSRDVRVGDARGGVQHSSVDTERAELVNHDRPLLVRGRCDSSAGSRWSCPPQARP